MAKLKRPDQKTLELKRTGTLNPHPDSVSDTLFKENPFFDPRDLPQHRGPKAGHKLSAEVIEYVRTLRAGEPDLTTVACVQAIQEKFGITVHRRSLERALASKKKPRNPA